MNARLKNIVRPLWAPLILFFRANYRSIFIWNRARRAVRQSSKSLLAIDSDRPLYVFFAPESGARPHFVAHCIIARILKELGHQVLMVRCFDRYRHCIVMPMMQLSLNKTTQQHRNACISCAETGLKMTQAYGLPTVELGELTGPDTVKAAKRLAGSIPSDAADFEVEGVKFGALCGSDVALFLKTSDQMRAKGEARELLQALIEDALVSYFAVRALAEKFNIGRLIFYNEYSMSLGAVVAAQKCGIPALRISHAIHRNIDRTRVIMMSDVLAVINYHRCLDNWPQWRNLALPPTIVAEITDNNIARFNASGLTVYSPRYGASSNDLYEHFGLDPKRKLLVAYTSSLDEYNSNRNLMASVATDLFQKMQPFVDQIEWLSQLATYVERSEHLQLIVRIHPREGRNSIDNRQSDHLQLLRRHFSGSWNHVRFVWPEENISSYDLAEMAQVALTSWTNITLELARFGVPTITAFRRYNPVPTDDVVKWASTRDGYFELIEEAIHQLPNLESIRYAYRWSYCAYLASSLDFGDLVPASDYLDLPSFHMPSAAKHVEDVVVRGQSVQEMSRLSLLSAQSADTAESETQALRQQLRRIIWFLATGEDRVDDDIRIRRASTNSRDDCDAIIDCDGDFVTFATSAKTVKKRSPAIVRLVELALKSEAPRHFDGIEPLAAR